MTTEITIEQYINGINQKNLNQRIWSFDTSRWILEFSKSDILKYLPKFIKKIKSLGVDSRNFDDLLAKVKNGELENLKNTLLDPEV